MRKCKCGSEMELMEDNINYSYHICTDVDCNWTLTTQCGCEDVWEEEFEDDDGLLLCGCCSCCGCSCNEE